MTPAMALRLGKLCGNGAEIWLNLQRTYNLAAEEKRLSAEIKKIPRSRPPTRRPDLKWIPSAFPESKSSCG